MKHLVFTLLAALLVSGAASAQRLMVGVRGGVINGDPGVGFDAYMGKRFQFSADTYDFNDPSLRLRAQYELNDAGTWLMGQWNDVNDSDKRAAYLGIRQTF